MDVSKKDPQLNPLIAQNATVDLLIMGSGTGMAAALAASENGQQCIVIEKTQFVGGSTARSGGAFWIPANKTLLADGSNDTLEKAEKYLNAVVGNNASPLRWRSFLKHGADAVEMLRRTTSMKFFWVKGYPDYHPEEPGGDALGRSCECKPFDLSILGKDKKRLRPGVMGAPVPMPVTGADYKWINLMVRKPFTALPKILKRLIQGIGGKMIGRDYAAGGQALAGGMFAGLLKAGIPVWTETNLIEVLFDGERVSGALIEQHGKRFTIKVRKGVVLAAGGFDHNLPMRQHYQSSTIVKDISLGSPGNSGDALNLVTNVKLKKTLMDQAWWFVAFAPLSEKELPQILLAERSLPGCIIVNEKGERFINEAMDYTTFGQIMRQKEKEGNPVETMWLVFDQKYKNNYLMAGSIFPRSPIPKSWYKADIAFSAKTPQELAEKIKISPASLDATLKQFNKMVVNGKDLDFHKGDSDYDHYYGDPTIKPNPNIRPLEGDLYAVKLVLTDLGTCGGLTTDENGLVLQEDGSAVTGLYALGNTTANVFGHTYPGAGGTIGPALVFGYIIGLHAAKQKPLLF